MKWFEAAALKEAFMEMKVGIYAFGNLSMTLFVHNNVQLQLPLWCLLQTGLAVQKCTLFIQWRTMHVPGRRGGPVSSEERSAALFFDLVFRHCERF